MLKSGSASAIHLMMVGHSTVLLLEVRALRCTSSILGSLRVRSLSTRAVPVTTTHGMGRVIIRLMVVSICALRVKILNLACVKLPHFISLLDGGIIRQIGGLAVKLMLSVRNKGHRKASPSRGRGANGSK